MDINALLANAPDTVPQDEHETAFDWDNAVISHSYTELKSKLGRPISDNPKQAVSIRFDSDVLAYFKARGKGWQTAMNNVLREYIATHQA
ncbi:MAG: BrnA antitoxin family protein [Moraxella sp.]|nr:BrnA antitoxin family protein [Moraxella sp.]